MANATDPDTAEPSSPGEGLAVGEDGRVRCAWGIHPDIYRTYHDTEWGRPVTDERAIFEKLCLEGFQAGLSWLTILSKRPAFRERFDGFDPEVLAAWGESEVEAALGDAGIVRNRAKVEATVGNARATLDLWVAGDSLSELLWSCGGASGSSPEAALPEATALSKALKKRGFRFVGPTTVYSTLQSLGVVNDHSARCWVHADCQAEQDRARGRLADSTG
ncbi:MAG: DNA-3-methyladenine glycosylase I [Candidatus Microthrix subdominans]|jgi:DNA-3-methyladenine glycosylase I|uniref:DNA-3-methyladenine glycosylase I n=1 Tax=Candidatus Neomicrothrix sp. TaxID=2719034 RepID=UPI002591909D|nr:DNA-3-methyladenine glycosylase I [Candidatus Microthrix sp.]HMS48500.1 DNA-3-methyladenine glycosylase I [Candidatus Microthrix sp.]